MDPKFFLTQNYFDPKFFLTHKFFRPGPHFLWTHINKYFQTIECFENKKIIDPTFSEGTTYPNLFFDSVGGEKNSMESMNGITGNSKVNLRGLADLDFEEVRVKWQQKTLIINSNPYLLGVCGNINT